MSVLFWKCRPETLRDCKTWPWSKSRVTANVQCCYCITFQAHFVATNWEWLSGNVGGRLWKPSMPLSSRSAFVSSEGPRPTTMASALLRCTSVRLPVAATAVLLLVSVTTVQSSQGDKEPVYRDCVKHCVRTNCTGARLRGFQSAQPQYMALTGELLMLLAGNVKLS